MPTDVAQGGSFLWEPAGSRDFVIPESFAAEQRQYAATADEFVTREIEPRLEAIEAKEPGLMRKLLHKAGEQGLLMAEVPHEFGGLGLDVTTAMSIVEHLSINGSFTVSLGAHTGIGTQPIVYFGTDAQQQAYLPKLATGERIAAYALTEPESGSDAMAAKTRADLDAAANVYRISGSKQFITNAGFADVFILFAKVDGDKFSAFIVDRDLPGLTVGAEEHKMGIRGSSTCPLTLDNVPVPVDKLLGSVGKGHKIAFNTLNIGRVKLGVGTVGSAKYALRLAAKYAAERKQFGRAIGTFGLVRTKLAEMTTRIFTAESMAYRTTGLIDSMLASAGENPEAKVAAIEEFTIEASMIKVFSSEALNLCVDEAVQIHGGYGFITDYPVERLFRDSRIHRNVEGTNEINRLIVPATLFTRAMKGQNPLLLEAQKVRARLAKDDIVCVEAGPMHEERTVAAYCKWITLYATAVAAEKHVSDLAEQQELLGEIADLITACYAIDSVIGRIARIVAIAGPEDVAYANDLSTSIIAPRYSEIVHRARHLLMDICDDKELDGHLAAIDKLRMDWPSKVLAANRRIADRVLGKGAYPTFACNVEPLSQS